jgi:asparaginyl-tRNA synthetase
MQKALEKCSELRILTLIKFQKQKKEKSIFSGFLWKKTNLTVSGQLEGETAAMGLGRIYTFGPTFRAENSNTTRHLAEFWMIEPEVAFNNLEDNIDLAEDFLKYVIKYVLDNCKDDLEFLDKRFAEEQNLNQKKKEQKKALSKSWKM